MGCANKQLSICRLNDGKATCVWKRTKNDALYACFWLKYGLIYRGGVASTTGGEFGSTAMIVGSSGSGCTSTTGIPSCEVSEKEDTLTYPLSDQ